MSITKFSKDVMLVFPDWESYSQSDTAVKNQVISAIEITLKRLQKLGFKELKLVGDNSISREALVVIDRFDFETKVIDVYPSGDIKEIIFSHIIGDERISYLEKYNTYKPQFNEKGLDELMNLEASIAKLLNGNGSTIKVKVGAEVNLESKLKIISKTIARSRLKMPIDKSILRSKGTEIPTFLRISGITQEELNSYILGDLENKWLWASNLIYNPTSLTEYTKEERVSNSEDEHNSEYQLTENDIAFLGTLGLMSDKDELKEKQNLNSSVTFKLDKEILNSTSNIINADIETKDELGGKPLIEALGNLKRDEFISSGELMEKLIDVLKLIDKYSQTILKKELESSNLIFDFSLSSTSSAASCIDYSSNDNKIIIKIDPRMGFVEPYFKGQSFRLDPMFLPDEEVNTNVFNW